MIRPEWLRIAMIVGWTIVLVIALAVLARAKEGGDWSNVDPEVRKWIKSLHRPDIGDGKSASCCGEGDAYFADTGETGEDGETYAIVTDNRGNPLPVGTRLKVRANAIQNREGNPTEHVVVFASEAGYVFCLVPNGGV